MVYYGVLYIRDAVELASPNKRGRISLLVDRFTRSAGGDPGVISGTCEQTGSIWPGETKPGKYISFLEEFFFQVL
jgi:hypothetical protein